MVNEERLYESPRPPEADELRGVDLLSKVLKFFDPDELSQLRSRAIEAGIAGDMERARELVDISEEVDQGRTQFGLFVTRSLLMNAIGRTYNCVENLEEVEERAFAMGRDDIVFLIESAKAQVLGIDSIPQPQTVFPGTYLEDLGYT